MTRGKPHQSGPCFLLIFLTFFWMLKIGKGNVPLNDLPIFQLSPEEDQKTTKSTVVEDEFIITFQTYFPREEHKYLLEQTIGHIDGWNLIERNNPAAKLPSDFALIKVNKTYSSSIDDFLSALRMDDNIKHVVPQRRYQNILSSHTPIPIIEKIPKNFTPAFEMNGRKHTAFPMEEEISNFVRSRKLHSGLIQVAHLLEADYLWDRGVTGTGVKVAVFDTGLRIDHPHFRNVKERTNWTDENTLEDGLGHGTFVTGVIASQSECLGFAPDVDIHVFRVFTNERVSYTSWFLDAFNYAILTKMNVLNLSIGGPDFMDKPFVEKVWEMSANKIIVVSAIGNDGPLYGTLNNPADQPDVIGVGGIDFQENVAAFSSRGMTTWELPEGYGRVKPDIVTFGQGVSGSRPYGGCRSLSGTSVASPVVAGAVALLASAIPEEKRWDVVNPASMKQVLIESAVLVPKAHIFEQGFGKLNLLGAYHLLNEYHPRASFAPASLDLTQCPYMWPYCTQPIYATGMPLIANVTILNGISVSSEIVGEPEWTPGENGELLEISFSFSRHLWPWTGWLGIRVQVSNKAAKWKGNAQGLISITIVSHTPGTGNITSTIQLPMRVNVVPTPKREQRVLFDMYHNLRYPSGYFPRDSLKSSEEPFDWNGDHIHTNFKDMYMYLREEGYFVEVLGSPLTCFNASNYGTLLLVDTEDEFSTEEISKIKKDIEVYGLSLVVFADWYNTAIIQKIKFFDANTEQWWTPATGGANVPALNDLLNPFGIAFSDRVYDGEFQLGTEKQAWYSSGTSIAKFPKGGSLVQLTLYDQTQKILLSKTEKTTVPVLGLLSTKRLNETFMGRIVVFGDSSCLDNANQQGHCLWLLGSILQYTNKGLFDENVLLGTYLDEEYTSNIGKSSPPIRMESSDLPKYSRTLGRNLVCPRRTYNVFNKSIDIVQISWEERIYSESHNLAQDRLRDRMRVEYQSGFTANINSYFIPYLMVCCVFVFLVVVAVKSRKAQRILHQRLLV